MMGIKLVRLIEAHSERLSRSLSEKIRNSERTSAFQKIPPEELRLAATEVYRNLGEWLLQKTEADIAHRFRAVAEQRASEGIPLHQLVWALALTRDHLWRFLRQQSFSDSIFELHGELEVFQMLNQFFDRAIYYAIVGYEQFSQSVTAKDDWARARAAAISIGLLSERAEPTYED